MKITRRAFQNGALAALLSAAGAGTAGIASVAQAATSVATGAPQYSERLRFFRKGHRFSFWIYLANPAAYGTSIPFALIISTDQAGSNIIKQVTSTSSTERSFTTRVSFVWDQSQPLPQGPLYCRLIKPGKPGGRIWTMMAGR